MRGKLLPQKLKELRKVNNYTQDYVAEVLGVVRQTYSHYETGKRTPDAEALYKLAGLYNISIDDLLHLTINIDRDISYDAPKPTTSSNDLSEYLEFFNNPANKKKYMFNTTLEKKELLFILIRFPKKIKKKLLNLQKSKHEKKLRPRQINNLPEPQLPFLQLFMPLVLHFPLSHSNMQKMRSAQHSVLLHPLLPQIPDHQSAVPVPRSESYSLSCATPHGKICALLLSVPGYGLACIQFP